MRTWLYRLLEVLRSRAKPYPKSTFQYHLLGNTNMEETNATHGFNNNCIADMFLKQLGLDARNEYFRSQIRIICQIAFVCSNSKVYRSGWRST